MFDPVFGFNPLNDLGQTVWPRDLPPLFLCRHHQPVDHGKGGFAVEASLGLPRAVTRGRCGRTRPVAGIGGRRS